MRSVFLKSLFGNIAAVQHLNNRQIKSLGKVIVTLVMRRHRHNCAGSVSHQHIIGNKYRNHFAVIRIAGFHPFQLNAGLAFVDTAL